MWTGLILGTLGAISTESWPLVWLIIEVNLMRFIPLIASDFSSKKICLFYFVIQSVGTLSILARGVLSDYTILLFSFAPLGIMLKTSVAPFHFWGPVLLPFLSKRNALLFLTWQKIAPVLLIFAVTPKILLNAFVILNLGVAVLCSGGSKEILVLLFFSGLTGMRWMFASPLVRAVKFFILYSAASAPVIMMTNIGCAPLLIMNLAGLPPMTGFFIKIRILQTVRVRIRVILLLLTVPLLFAYVRFFIMSPTRMIRPKMRTIIVCSIGCLTY